MDGLWEVARGESREDFNVDAYALEPVDDREEREVYRSEVVLARAVLKLAF